MKICKKLMGPLLPMMHGCRMDIVILFEESPKGNFKNMKAVRTSLRMLWLVSTTQMILSDIMAN